MRGFILRGGDYDLLLTVPVQQVAQARSALVQQVAQRDLGPGEGLPNFR